MAEAIDVDDNDTNNTNDTNDNNNTTTVYAFPPLFFVENMLTLYFLFSSFILFCFSVLV